MDGVEEEDMENEVEERKKRREGGKEEDRSAIHGHYRRSGLHSGLSMVGSDCVA